MPARPPRVLPSRLSLRLLVSLLSGVATGLAFEPVAWSPLLVGGVAGLTLALTGLGGRRAALLGLGYGVAFMGVLLPWIQVIGVDAWIGLTLLQAAFYALLGALLVRVMGLPGWPVWAATVWVAVDVARSYVPWGGFPWGRLAFATADTPVASAMTWVSTSGTTFLVALLGSALAWALITGRDAPVRAGVGVAAAVAAAAAPALATVVLPVEEHTDVVGEARVAAVQGNVPGEGMDAFAERRAVLDNHVAATRDLAARVDAGETPRPDFVLWPENSTDIDPFRDSTVYADIQSAVDAVGVPTLVGAMVGGEQPMDVYNQGIVWTPGAGPVDSYSKTHPVPFGEYIPHREQLAKLFERLDQIPRDMVPGTEPGLLDLGGTAIGDVICFEVAYDGVVHDVAELDPRLLVVQTNNATYMGTGQVEQQFAISRLRAIETGRHVVTVATNGISGIVAPDGSVVERATPRETVVMEADLPLRSGLTPAVRFGGALEVGLLLVAAGALLVAGLRDVRLRGRRPSAETSAGGSSTAATTATDDTALPTTGASR